MELFGGVRVVIKIVKIPIPIQQFVGFVVCGGGKRVIFKIDL